MPFCGCDKCGTVINTYEMRKTTLNGSRCWQCPDCGRPMRSVGIGEALELVRERAEADKWRADATDGADGARRVPSAARTAHP